jgi:hypothetical protein
MRMGIRIQIVDPTGRMTYQASDVWFACRSWDEFVNSVSVLDGIALESVVLKNLSEHFSISISLKQEKLGFVFNCLEVYSGESTSKISYESEIDMDTLGHIQWTFNQSEKWW